ncbi:hypothetical protein ACLVWU_12065 [Bdellovibrio sp. HCB290]|uniref:hypothetical protein n=1 Tax=Bdellovibrio sp. HCB290 TaxID=3394356 RepID=UPI0039B62E7F
MATSIRQRMFSDNFSKEKFEDPGIPQREPKEISGVHDANQKKAEEGVQVQKTDWDQPDGEYSEVMDSEGHRVRINHY